MLYTERFGASPFTTGLLLAVYSGMGFIFSPVVGALSGPDRETFVTLFREGRGRVIVPLMAAYFFMMAGFTIMTAFFAIFTEDRFGYNASGNGYIFAGVGVISVIVQGAMIGRLIKNFTEKGIALTGVALLACIFALPLVRTVTTLLLVGAGIAVGNSFINPTMVSTRRSRVSCACR